MKTITDREAIALQLLPFLNGLANENKDAIRYIAEKKEEITLSDLTALSDEQLDKLEALMKSAKAVKLHNKKTKQYDSLMKPEVSSVTDKPKHTFIC
jgi:hypothetical protein